MPAPAGRNTIPMGHTFWGKYSLDGGGAHREEDFDSAMETAEGRTYGRHDKRIRRYRLFWSFYANTVYQQINRWSESLIDERDLYGFVRNLYSPGYLVGEFWTSHLMGGPLDPEAGDGKDVPSALPIITENEFIRPVIAQIWADSNWQANKEIFGGYGAILGDSALAAVDDPVRGKVYHRVVHPQTIARLERDVFGNVKEYEIVEMRLDPEWDEATQGPAPEVVYREECWRDEADPQLIHYRTTKGDSDEPYDWRDYPPGTPDSAKVGGEWTEPYGFVPMVVVAHRDRGHGWGYSELFPGLSRFYEVDNLASVLADQIQKVIQAPQLIAGAKKAEVTEFSGIEGRRDWPYLFCENAAVKAQSLSGDLDIGAASAFIAGLIADIERMYPELRADEAGADASGVSRRIARERIEARVIQRRAPYDAALVRMHEMELSILAMRQYKGYPKLPSDAQRAYDSGQWKHSIGPRPVFTITAAERLEEATARAVAVKGFTDAGLPLRRALIEVGYTEVQADEIMTEKEADDAAQLERMRQEQQISFDAEAAAGVDPQSGGSGGSGAGGNKGTPGGVMR